MNQTNKEEQSSAEPGEKRVRAKVNIVAFNTHPTQRGEIECASDGAVYEGYPSSSLIQGGSRMRESRSYGSVRGATSDGRPYRNIYVESTRPLRETLGDMKWLLRKLGYRDNEVSVTRRPS